MVLAFAETTAGKFKKSAFEAVTYAYQTAQAMGTECAALVLGAADNAAQLGKYGASKVLHASGDAFGQFDAQVYTAAIAGAAQQAGASVIVLSHSSTEKVYLAVWRQDWKLALCQGPIPFRRSMVASRWASPFFQVKHSQQ